MVFKVLSYMDVIIPICVRHIFPQIQVTQYFLSGEKNEPHILGLRKLKLKFVTFANLIIPCILPPFQAEM